MCNNKLLNQQWDMVLLRYVSNYHNEENDLYAVAVLSEKVKYFFKFHSTFHTIYICYYSYISNFQGTHVRGFNGIFEHEQSSFHVILID